MFCFCSLVITYTSTSSTETSGIETTIPDEEAAVETEEPTTTVAEAIETAAIESLPCAIAFQSDRDGNRGNVSTVMYLKMIMRFSRMEENPKVGVFRTDESVSELLIAASGVLEGQPPYILCQANDDLFEMWQQTTENNSLFQCIATVNPGGTAYEGIYTAYYGLAGHEIDPNALGGQFGNTFIYDFPAVTNETLDEFLANKGDLRMNDWGDYELAPMTPEEILEAWFIN